MRRICWVGLNRTMCFVAIMAAAVLAVAASEAGTKPPASADAAAKPAVARPAAGEEMIQFNLPNELQVKVLVEYVTKRLGLNLL